MKKRFSVLGMLVLGLTLALCGCDDSSTIVTLDDEDKDIIEVENESSSKVLVFSTRDDKEYLEFLTQCDEKYEIIDITTGMPTYYYGESYMVTYSIKNDVETNDNISYKYYIYKTSEQSKYIDFYSSFDFDTYEIVDISTRLPTYYYDETYMITYRRQKN